MRSINQGILKLYVSKYRYNYWRSERHVCFENYSVTTYKLSLTLNVTQQSESELCRCGSNNSHSRTCVNLLMPGWLHRYVASLLHARYNLLLLKSQTFVWIFNTVKFKRGYRVHSIFNFFLGSFIRKIINIYILKLLIIILIIL
jgi:hypothetical protein